MVAGDADDTTYWSSDSCESSSDSSNTISDIIVSDVCTSTTVTNPERMLCFLGKFNHDTGKFYPDADGNVTRCGCWRLFPMDGPDCGEFTKGDAPGNFGGYFSLVWFMLLVIMSFYVSVESTRGYYFLFQANRAAKHRKSFRQDVGAQTCLLVGIGCAFQGLFCLTLFFRALPTGMQGIGNSAYYRYLFTLPATIIFIFQSQVGIALAWIEIAIKSTKVSGNAR